MSKTTFVIGANGIGKTTVMNDVQKLLSRSDFELHDFDERGVPDNADKTWRMSEAQHWISVGKENQKKGLSTIIFGFSKPEEIGTEAEIIFIDKPAYRQGIRSLFRSRNLRFGTFLELLAVGIQDPNRQRHYPIVALGATYKERDKPDFIYKGMCYAPYLYGNKTKRGIDVFWVEEKWDEGWAFLGIRCRNPFELEKSFKA